MAAAIVAAATGLGHAGSRQGPNLSLMGRLRCAPAAATSVDRRTGVSVIRSLRSGAVANGLCLQVQVRTTSTGVARPGRVEVARWSFGPLQADDTRYQPLAYRDDTWYGSTYWAGPDWTRVGRDWQHPGTNTACVRTYTAPRAGRIHISGRVCKADTNGGDGIAASIEQGGRRAWSAELEFNDSKGVDPNLDLEVRVGEVIRFVVDKRGAIECDTTRWAPVVRYADGTTSRADASFDRHSQGEGGWSYELRRNLQEEGPALPTLHGIDHDSGALLAACPQSGTASLDAGYALPAWVLSDERSAGGLAITAPGMPAPRLEARRYADGRLDLVVTVDPGLMRPGATVSGGTCAVTAYSGEPADGFAALERMVAALPSGVGGNLVRDEIARVRTAAGIDGLSRAPRPDLALWWRVVTEWAREDGPNVSGGVDRQLVLARKSEACAGDSRFAAIERAMRTSGDDPGALATIYYRLRWLKRAHLLAAYLPPGKRILFAKRVPTGYSHEVMQYYGWRARPGGGIFVLDRPGYSLAARDILGGRLAAGSVLEPRLSFDARRVVFSWVACSDQEPDPNAMVNGGPPSTYFHLYEAALDGSGMRQVTRGSSDDLMPTYLPDGGIAFSSTRRQGYSRCFGPQFSTRWHVYTLHRVERDGSRVRQLSYHDTNEWFPTVGHDGQVLYSRWDYIDRDAVTHQNLWATRPDGTGTTAVWGNATDKPHCTFQPQAIPGTRKVVFTASAHHSVTGGSIAILDPTVGDNGLAAIKRITPSVPFPEAEGMSIREYYASPWPLSEKAFLVSYSPYPLVWEPGANRPDGLGIYLIDTHGNRELLYRDAHIGSTSPCIIAPRPVPPVLPPATRSNAPNWAEMSVEDIYRGLPGARRGEIQSLRVVQVLPKSTPVANTPPVGVAGEENGRVVLGTVPIEADGSARFRVPAGKPLLFQALDRDGMAFQTMRTIAYAQPGEKVACVGCHERRTTSPHAPGYQPLAMRKPAVDLLRGPLDGSPFSYMRAVQPVLDRHCTGCHGGVQPAARMDLTGRPAGPYVQSYVALTAGPDFNHVGTNPANAAQALVPRFGMRNQVQVTDPGGLYGARGSRLVRLLKQGHAGVKLTADELASVACWIDCNAIFYGVNQPAEQMRQLRGEVVGIPTLQ